jgi:hypothetical protein
MPLGDSPVTERNTPDRVTSYGDRVVEAGDRATATPAAPPRGAKRVAEGETETAVAEIVLIDSKGLLGKDLSAAVISAVEMDLNALYTTPLGKQFVRAKLSVRFSVTRRSSMPSQAERGAFGALQYPIYVLNGHTNDAATVSEIETLMKHHGIVESGPGKQQFEAAREGWKAKPVEGLGIQPLEGYRKVGFIKADRVFATRGDFETLFRNVIKHELGHMFNLKEHSEQVMRDKIVLADAALGYTEDQTRRILQEIARLKTKGARMEKEASENR